MRFVRIPGLQVALAALELADRTWFVAAHPCAVAARAWAHRVVLAKHRCRSSAALTNEAEWSTACRTVFAAARKTKAPQTLVAAARDDLRRLARQTAADDLVVRLVDRVPCSAGRLVAAAEHLAADRYEHHRHRHHRLSLRHATTRDAYARPCASARHPACLVGVVLQVCLEEAEVGPNAAHASSPPRALPRQARASQLARRPASFLQPARQPQAPPAEARRPPLKSLEQQRMWSEPASALLPQPQAQPPARAQTESLRPPQALRAVSERQTPRVREQAPRELPPEREVPSVRQ